jgi:hypothetical protein
MRFTSIITAALAATITSAMALPHDHHARQESVAVSGRQEAVGIAERQEAVGVAGR